MNRSRITYCYLIWFGVMLLGSWANAGEIERALMAGASDGVPSDTPSRRIDSLGMESPYNSVGSLTIQSSSGTFLGSAIALDPFHLLTAGHNVDVNDDGIADIASLTFNLPTTTSYQSYSASSWTVNPDFDGFLADGIVNDDLAIIQLSNPLPNSLNYFPLYPNTVIAGTELTLVGFGASGYGNYYYSVSGNRSTRRSGGNLVDSFWRDDEGSGNNEIFLYDFDAPSSIDSLGNDWETLIGPGDSGGPALVSISGTLYLAGINTFTMGPGSGTFGNNGGGILLEPYLEWITSNSYAAIPEPGSYALVFSVICLIYFWFLRGRCWKISG